MDEFALSALSQESAFNSSSHVSVFNCCSALDTVAQTGENKQGKTLREERETTTWITEHGST